MRKKRETRKKENLQLNTINPVLPTVIPNSILKNQEISAGAKVIFGMFCYYAWQNDSCFPGQVRLAEDIGLSRVRVTELIAELEKSGFVTIQRRGQGKTNLYTIHY